MQCFTAELIFVYIHTATILLLLEYLFKHNIISTLLKHGYLLENLLCILTVILYHVLYPLISWLFMTS